MSFYTSSLKLGNIISIYYAIISTIASLLILILGIYIIYHKNYLTSTDGEVIKSSNNCLKIGERYIIGGSSPIPSITCNFDVKYLVNNKNYNKTLSSLNIYKVEDKVTVWYDKNNPDKSELNPISTTVGWFIIILSLFILLSGWFIFWLCKKNKFISAFFGFFMFISICILVFNKIIRGIFVFLKK
jgi:hypothetical protein